LVAVRLYLFVGADLAHAACYEIRCYWLIRNRCEIRRYLSGQDHLMIAMTMLGSVWRDDGDVNNVMASRTAGS